MRIYFSRFKDALQGFGYISLVIRRGLLLFACGALSCGGDIEVGERRYESCELGTEQSGAKFVTFSSFWNPMNGEAAALTALHQQLEGTDTSLSLIPLDDRDTQQQNLRQWLHVDADQRPDVYQGNSGSDMFQFVEGETRELCPLDRFAETHSVPATYFPSAVSSLSCRGTLFALPIGMHRVNVLYVNTEVYEQAVEAATLQGVAYPPLGEIRTAEEFVQLAETTAELHLLTADAQEIVPIALSATEGWPLQLLAHDSLLASYSESAYRGTWMGRPDGQTEEELTEYFAMLADHVERLGAVSNMSDGNGWTEAIDLVASGSALFTVMGDWGAARLEGATAQRVDLVPFPGLEDRFVYTVDSFAVPKKFDSRGTAVRTFLEHTTLSRPGLLKFSAAKHSIPPIEGLTADELATLPSPIQRRTYERFAECSAGADDCTLLPAVSGLAPAAGLDPCFERTGTLLGWLAGSRQAQAAFSEDACDEPVPQSHQEARAQLIEQLVRVSEHPYAETCRPDN